MKEKNKHKPKYIEQIRRRFGVLTKMNHILRYL